ncbi:hypothetical protein Tco_0190014 [Tanacetum coccineum]
MGTPTLICVWSCPNFSAPAALGVDPKCWTTVANHEEGERVNGLVKVEGVEDLGEGRRGSQWECRGVKWGVGGAPDFSMIIALVIADPFYPSCCSGIVCKSSDVVLTRWIEKMEYVQDMKLLLVLTKKIRGIGGSNGPKIIEAMQISGVITDKASSIKDMILAAQKEVVDESAGLQKGLDQMIEQRSDGILYYMD